jgi:hypothetical protein
LEDEDEFEGDEPTLTRDNEENVVFDMDTVLSHPRVWLNWVVDIRGG